MTAFELLNRMSLRELTLWIEYDRVPNLSKQDYQFAAVMAKLDWIKGVKRPDPSRYLPKVEARRRRKSLAEIKSNFNAAVANSGRRK